jgi:dTDP-4-amino-4,6-dideoxygalactose transaminase
VPVLVDVERDTGNLDPSLIEAARTERTKAVVVVHLYGRPATRVNTDLLVIEDAAQAHGAIIDHGRSDAIAYSFYPTKNLGGIGDGGAVVSRNAELIALLRSLRVHGMSAMYVHDHISQNFRMSELEAAWLRLALVDVRKGNERRRDIAARYRAAAPHLVWQDEHVDHVYHQCVVRFSDREAKRARLAELGVATAIHYPLAVTQQPAYRHLARVACPHAEAWAAECVSLPCFPELTDAEVDHVANAIAAVGS